MVPTATKPNTVLSLSLPRNIVLSVSVSLPLSLCEFLSPIRIQAAFPYRYTWKAFLYYSVVLYKTLAEVSPEEQSHPVCLYPRPSSAGTPLKPLCVAGKLLAREPKSRIL